MTTTKRLDGEDVIVDVDEPCAGWIVRTVRNNHGGATTRRFETSQPRTNLSGEARDSGFLGETDNVARFAEGRAELRANSRGDLRLYSVAE